MSKPERVVQKAGRAPKWNPPVVYGPKASKSRRYQPPMNTRGTAR